MRRVIQAICFLAFGLIVEFLCPVPAGAVGGTCSSCRGNYESCMQDAYFNGSISPQEDTFCRTLTASCWNHCQAVQYRYCSYIYDSYISSGTAPCNPGWYTGEDWQTNHGLSACPGYVSYGATLNCQTWP